MTFVDDSPIFYVIAVIGSFPTGECHIISAENHEMALQIVETATQVGYPWITLGLPPLDYPWTTLGLLLDYPWTTPVLP